MNDVEPRSWPLKRLALSLLLALAWYGMLFSINRALGLEPSIVTRTLSFPYGLMIWLVERLSGVWSPIQEWLYTPPQMMRAAVAALLGYLLFWWAAFYALISLVLPRFQRKVDRA